jgi:hypothetical protein
MDAKTYNKVVRRAAILASRLLETPQALHYFHTVYFGEDTKIPGAPYKRVGHDKNINTLSLDDIEATREELILLADNIHFEFFDIGDAYGRTLCYVPVAGVGACKSVILLSMDLYSAAQNGGVNDVHNAKIDFSLATTIIHELAHAVTSDVAGDGLEDCFEESLVAEAGFELESRTFGLCWDSEKLLGWYNWQTSWLCGSDYDMRDICCDPSKLVKESIHWDSDYNFLLKLFDDSFWTGDYARRGSVALLPPPVIDICRQGVSSKGPTDAYLALPVSVKQRWMASKGLKFSQQKDPELADEESEIQTPTTQTERGYWYLAAVDDSGEKVLRYKRRNGLRLLQDAPE